MFFSLLGNAFLFYLHAYFPSLKGKLKLTSNDLFIRISKDIWIGNEG